MNQREIEERVKEVFSDKEYVTELLGLETPEEVQASLAEKGVDLSIDDIIAIGKILGAADGTELSDEELENVSGGAYGILAAIIGGLIVVAFGGAVTQLATRGRW